MDVRMRSPFADEPGHTTDHTTGPDPAGPPEPDAHRPPPGDPDPGIENPVVQWWRDMRGDVAGRRARGDGRWWWMRWMAEQPTSVADHLDYYLGQRQHRPGGRAGWGLHTAIPLINDVHAVLYVAFGVTWGLVWTLAGYAVTWAQQRPGRAFLLAAALLLIKFNLSAWRAGS